MIKIEEKLSFYQTNFNVISTTFLTQCQPHEWVNKFIKLQLELESSKKESYNDNDRLLFVFDTQNYSTNSFKSFFKKFINILNQVDISTFFVVILINDDLTKIEDYFRKYSTDSVMPTVDYYGKTQNNVSPADTFCVAPWVHLMVNAYQDILTCCSGTQPLGAANKETLKDAWFSTDLEEIRQYMLNGDYHTNCSKCYELESTGTESLRQVMNKKFEHLEPLIRANSAAVVNDFKLKCVDMRFTNLCNLRCRTCSHHSSSKWHQDTIKLNPLYDKPVILKSGRTDTDLWEQLAPHLDYVEQIYFAGGEPLIMEEHYKILDALVARNRLDVKLHYNTNFLQTSLKKHNVFDYWKIFKNVTVFASLDASGSRAEYVRKDTNWDVICQNRQTMINVCPDVSFNVNMTASILNVWHLSDFHRSWVEQGLIKINDFSIQHVQFPHYYRVDIATPSYKNLVKEKILKHCQWLEQFTNHSDAVSKFKALIDFMMSLDNTKYLEEFWQITSSLDKIRNESVLDALPELLLLK